MQILVLSGPVCAGKTTLADGLREHAGAEVLTTRVLIAKRAGISPAGLSRRQLQELGDQLDTREGGDWVANAVRGHLGESALTIVDAARTPDQLTAIRPLGRVLHAHLTAPEVILERRYAQRISADPELELPDLAALRRNMTEAAIERLAGAADIVIDTSTMNAKETLGCVLAALN